MSDLEARKRANLRDNFPYYARHCLKIRSDTGKIVPLELNQVQRIVHAAAEAQLAETGRVRVLVLKARKPGISTYVEGRFYHRTTHGRGLRAFILTHRDEATSNLFGIAKRYHDNCPFEVRPQTQASNAKELDFGRLDSGYRVGTAKAAGVGRSDTIQFFHGSEVAFWPNAAEHAAGVLQAVPHEPGTEVWLESTANGIGGLFYNMCMAALQGLGEYTLIFIPWFVHESYVEPPPGDFVPPVEFAEYGELHDLAPKQLYWAYVKNGELAAAEGLDLDRICWRFRQEYPATAQEAFRANRGNSYISPERTLAARKHQAPAQKEHPIIIGCDFARGERDRNWFIDRQGRAVGRLVDDRFHSEDTVEIADRLARHIDAVNPDQCFLDTGGGGAAVYDILKSRRYGAVLTLINFGSRPQDRRKYANKRAEMWGRGKEWLDDEDGADIPDSDELDGDITSCGWKENTNNQVVLEPKDKIRERLGFSPDGGDAWALTFARSVRKRSGPARARKGDSSYDPHTW